MDLIKEDTVVIQEKEKNEFFCKVVSGSFAVFINYGQPGEYLLGIVSKGRVFGEIGFLSEMKSPYTVVANEDSLVLKIDKNNFYDFIKNNTQNAIDIMKSTSKMAGLLQEHINWLNSESNLEEERKKELTNNLKSKIKQYQNFRF